MLTHAYALTHLLPAYFLLGVKVQNARQSDSDKKGSFVKLLKIAQNTDKNGMDIPLIEISPSL